MDFDPVPFYLLPAVIGWVIVCGVSVALVMGVSFLAMLASRGGRGVVLWGNELGGMLSDVFSISPKRVLALAQLTWREAIRRKALLVFVVFAVLFMFAGWFLSSSDLPPEFQVKVYVTFVLRAISWLILPVVLLLSCWGIPEDIKQRSLHTVVTKPARRLEIVLGRMLGFSVVATVVLVVMAVVGEFWINRQLSEDAKKFLTCRQPIFGALHFIDRDGNPAAAGINVGDIWMFHSYIEGASKARAVFTFTNLDAGVLDAEGNLRLENRFQAFRSHKGDMRRPLYYQYVLINPDTGLRVPISLKTVNEFRGRTDVIPRALPKVEEATAAGKSDAESGKAHDLIDDVISKQAVVDPQTKQVVYPAGSMVVEVIAIDPGQYLGMARPDLFIRTPDRPFWVGYVKAVFGIELMLLLVVMLGVTASTFVKGPVATLVTFCFIIVGQTAREFMHKLVSGSAENGGGVFESIYRIVAHMNPTTPLPEGPATQAMKFVDGIMLQGLWLVEQIIPSFDFFTHSLTYLANGFDVRFDSAVLPGIAIVLGYFLPCVLLGYFCLRIRELESK
ncbi:MAG: hypothetical protein SH850_05785 [Planctomycetaceae bacterium]|nr:hypothetical protein [Planctomycetaceae bacterium]